MSKESSTVEMTSSVARTALLKALIDEAEKEFRAGNRYEAEKKLQEVGRLNNIFELPITIPSELSEMFWQVREDDNDRWNSSGC